MLNSQTSQRAVLIFMVVIIAAVLSVVVYTNTTLRSIEKNLPNTLLTELNSLSGVLEGMSRVVSSARIAKGTQTPASLLQLKEHVEILNRDIVELRDTYVVNNLVNASAFHTVAAPAVADLQIWLNEGVSGYKPDSSIILQIVEARIVKAYQKANTLKYDSQLHTQIILDNQRNRLERFLFSVNLLFVLTIIIACCLIFLLFRQILLRGREVTAKNQLREQHDLLASLLQNLPEGIAVWDQNRNIVHLNKSFIDITGYNREDLPDIGKWAELAFPDPLYRQSVKKDWKRVLKGDAVSEYKVTCKDGKVKEIVIRAAFLPGSRIINTLTDVTRRNKDEKALQESREIKARSKKMESLGLLAGGVAHDLNNILSGIVSYPELLLLDLAEDHKLRKPIEIIRDSGRKATAIVMDLLTVARGVAISKEPVNVNSIIQDYLKSPDFQLVQTYHPDVTVEMSLTEYLFNITGSMVHIRKILMNLISNGCEAIKRTGCVRISTVNSYIDTPLRGYDHVEEGEYVLLSVADQGEGISDDSLERIFEPFYSKKMMGRSGTGLGLAVVWNVVQDHHGYITVESSEKGTTFSVYFPATREDVSGRVSLLEISSFSGAGESILVVDDLGSQREISSGILKKLGYSPESVAGGEEAVAFIKKHPVDLIVLDMIMDPGISGRETYARILQINPKQKAIIVSGFAETEDVKKTLEMGADCYLKKPIEIEKLGVAIRDVLNIAS